MPNRVCCLTGRAYRLITYGVSNRSILGDGGDLQPDLKAVSITVAAVSPRRLVLFPRPMNLPGDLFLFE